MDSQRKIDDRREFRLVFWATFWAILCAAIILLCGPVVLERCVRGLAGAG